MKVLLKLCIGKKDSFPSVVCRLAGEVKQFPEKITNDSVLFNKRDVQC